MNHYKVTFAAHQWSNTQLLRSDDSVSEVTARFALYLPQGWSLTVERIV